jgi:hypothetical protein
LAEGFRSSRPSRSLWVRGLLSIIIVAVATSAKPGTTRCAQTRSRTTGASASTERTPRQRATAS